MSVQEEIDRHIAGQPQAKRDDMLALHRLVLGASPDCKLWFLDGRNDEGKVVTNPSIGYGMQTLTYAKGETRDFYRIGVSGNTSGISVYIIGLKDRKYLAETYGKALGKAKVTGYCITFKDLKDVNRESLEEIVESHMNAGLGS